MVRDRAKLMGTRFLCVSLSGFNVFCIDGLGLSISRLWVFGFRWDSRWVNWVLGSEACFGT